MKHNIGGLKRAPLCAFLGLNGIISLGCGHGSKVEAEPIVTQSYGVGECPDVGLDAAEVYYVCDCQAGAASGCEPGNDAYPGTLAAPFRTYGRALQAFANLQAGETVAFCRGGSFTIDGDREWVNASCTAAEPCVVRDYDPPWSSQAVPKPILETANADGFSFADGGPSNHEEGYIFLNLDIRSTSGGTSGNGFFVYNDIDDVLVCGMDITGFDIGFYVAGSQDPEPGSDGKNSKVVLQYSALVQNGNQGYMGGCDECGVIHSYFEDNGFSGSDPSLNHNIYFDARGADRMFASYNTLYRSAFVSGECRGAPLVVHGRQTNLVIEGNYVREDPGAAGAGCWGIAVDAGYGGEAEGFQNVRIDGNTVENVGNVGIGVNACQNCEIENNVVIQEQDFESTLISAPDRDRGSNDLPFNSVKIRNNTLFARSASKVTGVYAGGEGSGHEVVSNALLSLGTGDFVCFDYDLAHGNYAARDNNLCYASSGADWTSSTPSLITWRAESGDDLASFDANPLFTSTTDPFDFTPTTSSPLVGAGHDTLSAVDDFNGNTRDSQPDIGAIER